MAWGISSQAYPASIRVLFWTGFLSPMFAGAIGWLLAANEVAVGYDFEIYGWTGIATIIWAGTKTLLLPASFYPD